MFKKAACLLIISVFWITAFATTPFVADTAHSNVGFSIPIAGGLSKVTGKFSNFTAKIDYDEKDITKSSVEAVIKAESIDTGIEPRDKHLRTADFFDVEKFPEITFKSKKIEKKGKILMMTGDFTMHGITKEISFPFTPSGECLNKSAQIVPCGFSANLKINRKDYGISYARKDNPTFLGDVVEVDLNILATKPKTN